MGTYRRAASLSCAVLDLLRFQGYVTTAGDFTVARSRSVGARMWAAVLSGGVCRGTVVRRNRVSAAAGWSRAAGGPGLCLRRSVGGLRRPGRVDDLPRPPLEPAILTGLVIDELPGRAVSFAWPRRGGPPSHLLQASGNAGCPCPAGSTRRVRPWARCAASAVTGCGPGPARAGDGQRSTAAFGAASRPIERGPVNPGRPSLRNPSAFRSHLYLPVSAQRSGDSG